MHSAKKGFWAVLMLVPLMLGGSVFSNEPAWMLNRAAEVVVDDEVPEETARVARISFIQGDVKIRRAEMEDWEKASQNLPIVEGDEITTDANARFEIQFNSSTFMRVGGNSYVKVVGLKDEGIAVSLPQGTMSVRIYDFEGDKTYFEIDAPKTTIAVQKSGVYRVDAGQKDSPEIRLSVTEEGEARVYTESSGFALKSGRSAKIFIDGINAGESEMADASLFRDDLDSWTADRDAAVAKNLKDAYYGKYYDRDIYGAEDLNDYGEWIHTPEYGYVWRPYQSSVNVYADWSPYRYGHWRWIPPYGWTWVNDEPWGWATYHHGRWFYLNGRWCWSPYGYYRGRRSWWRPALVAITIVNNNVCWWPLSYHHRYRNYNRRHRRDRNNHPQPGPSPTPTRTPSPTDRQDGPLEPSIRREKIRVPTSGVIMAESGDIETGRRRYRTPSVEVATTILSQDADATTTSGPVLPAPDRRNGPISGDTRVEAPRIIRRDPSVKIGAGERPDGGPLDDVLRRTRIYGDRTPRPSGADTTVINGEPRRTGTGAVERPPITPRVDGPAVSTPEQRDVPRERRRERPAEQEPSQTPPIIAPRSTETPSKQPEPKTERPRREDAPVEQPQPRYEPPKERSEPRREEPRYEPPPRREEPRNDTPQRSEPRSDPPKREDPPAKSEPSQPSPSERKGKPR